MIGGDRRSPSCATSWRRSERGGHRARRRPVMASSTPAPTGAWSGASPSSPPCGDAVVPTLGARHAAGGQRSAGPGRSHRRAAASRPSAWATSPSRPSPTARCGSTSRRPIPRASSPPPTCWRGAVDPRQFERKLVLIGVTAVGLGDRHATPVAPAMSGVEIHAQLLESIFDGALLARPRWARWAEAALLALGGGRADPRRARVARRARRARWPSPSSARPSAWASSSIGGPASCST